MKDKNYWKNYPVCTDPKEIEKALYNESFLSKGVAYKLLRFYKSDSATNILITPGSGGHAYVFAELGYLIHRQGFNVFIMPKHEGYTIPQLSQRHTDAIHYIRSRYPGDLHLYGEGLGGMVIFYQALAGIPVQSIICENAPALLTDKAFHQALRRDGPAGKRRTLLLPFLQRLENLFPRLPIPIKSYLKWEELIDISDEHNRVVEERLVNTYRHDPDFDTHYPLRAVLSLVGTPPPRPLAALSIPTLFIVAKRGLIPEYFMELFRRLPLKTKRLEAVDGGAFWMLSHPEAAARIIGGWVQEINKQRELFNTSTMNHENH